MSNNFYCIYAFTNENISSFEKIYNFNDAKVLSVIGSGDQYFSSLLYGAKDIILYDSNPESWFYFILKFYALMILSYEEFYEFSISNKFDNQQTLEKVLKYLPENIKNHLTNFIKREGSLSKLFLYSSFPNHDATYQSGETIPYFDPEKYYKLQSQLRNTRLPKVYISDILNLPQKLGNEHFDIMLASNIFNWIMLSPQEYLRFLKRFRTEAVQAHYIWNSKSNHIQQFADLGFDIDSVPPVTGMGDDLHCEKNFVISKQFIR